MKAGILRGFSALALATATVTTLPALQASASEPAASVGLKLAAASATPGPTVSATVACSWQTNSTVWAIAAVHGVVFVGGSFTSVRPPGAALGTGEVARTYLAEFNASTGALITSFDPILDGQVTALAVSPDGSTLYVGGSFTHVNTTNYRNHLAAFSVASGALSTTWKPNAAASVLSIAPSPDGSEIYIGGNFTSLDGTARTRAGAVDAATGTSALPWAPNVNGSVTSVAVAPDDSRVLVGGYFTAVNGVTQQAIGSTNPATGASEPWAATILPHTSTCVSTVKDIIVNGATAYIAAEGSGGGCFDGDFAANISDGALVWQNDCLGATQSLALVNDWLYKGSHAHDCAYTPGGFPQVANSSGTGWVTYHLLDQSLVDGSLGYWTPNTDAHNLGPRVMATDGSQLFLGGDFAAVNGKTQQGFARFPAAPDATAPKRPAAPTVISTSAGVDSVTFPAVSDIDNGTLTYSIYRDGGTTPIGTVTAASWYWALPVVHYRDAGLTAGTKHTYVVSASDGVHSSSKSLPSASVTVSATNPSATYYTSVLNNHPSFYWRLGQTSGTVAADSTSHGFTGIYEPGTTLGVPGALTGNPDTATGFDGKTGLVTSSAKVTGPQTFSLEGWFKTTTNTGGEVIGFGSSQTGSSSQFDRHIYMMNDGQVVFGVYNAGVRVIESPNTYNDGQWHYMVATLGAAGMALYLDGRLIGTNATTAAAAYTGYWRVGGDTLPGWNLAAWHSNSQGTTQPNSYYFKGTIDEVAVYPAALSAATAAAHYAANSLSH